MSHYFQPDAPTDVQDAALMDWIEALGSYPQPAVDHACWTYLRDQPRRRPTPGDILARARGWHDMQRRQGLKLGGEGLSEAQQEAVDWAVKRGRLLRADAVAAVKCHVDLPAWLENPSEAQRCIYAIRQHPSYEAKADA